MYQVVRRSAAGIWPILTMLMEPAQEQVGVAWGKEDSRRWYGVAFSCGDGSVTQVLFKMVIMAATAMIVGVLVAAAHGLGFARPIRVKHFGRMMMRVEMLVRCSAMMVEMHMGVVMTVFAKCEIDVV